MNEFLSPKVIGATAIGLMLIVCAYLLSSNSNPQIDMQARANSATTPARSAIIVTDSDQNGIEDWRDEFVTPEPIRLDKTNITYTPPETLTESVGIGLMEKLIQSRAFGNSSEDDQEIVDETVKYLASQATDKLYKLSDIKIKKDWDHEDVVKYANTLADILYTSSNPELEGELEILYDITNNNSKREEELIELSNIYKEYLDRTLDTPVPSNMTKEHLDLINSYNAIYNDILGMSIVKDDPMTALLRIKRYQDDGTGLAYSLQNIYFALKPYTKYLKKDDPALLFTAFSPDYQG